MRNGSGESGELPPGWAWAYIDDFSDHCLGKMLDAGKKRFGDPLPYLRNINVRWGAFDLEELYEMPFEAAELRRYGIVDGDVLVCEGGEPGRCAVWRAGPTEIKIQKALHRLRCYDGISPEFVALQLKFLAINDRLSSHFTGTTIKHLPGVALKQVRIRLAPVAEQRRIAAKIDELFGEIEAGEQELEKAREGLAGYRRAVLKAAVTGELTREWREKNAPNETGADFVDRILAARRAVWERAEIGKLNAKAQTPKADIRKVRYTEPVPPDTSDLPELPEGWVWASLDQLSADSCYGTSVKCSYEASGIPVLRIPNIRNGTIDDTNLKFSTTDLGLDDDEMLRAGDFLVIRTNGSEGLIGRGGVVLGATKRPSYFASYLIRFRLLSSDTLWRWVTLIWNSDFIRALVREHAATSAGQYNISQSKLAKFPVPLPGGSELVELLSKIEEQNETMAETEAVLSSDLPVDGLRQSILAAAFSGKLVPQDPADEPADVLLERFRAAKASAEPQKRGSRSAPSTPLAPRRRGASRDPAASAARE